MKRHCKKQLLLTFSLCLLIFAVSAQNSDELWTKKTDFEKTASKKLIRKSLPKKFEIYQLNVNQLKSRLNNAPKRKGNLEKSNTVISFPNENGKLEKYRIFEASVMEENLQKQYPDIRSYVGKGIDNPGSAIRFSVSPFGLHAMFLGNAEGSVYIDPYTENNDSYIFYSSKNLPAIEPFECKFDEVNTSQKTTTTTISAKAENANDGKLRTFRLAVATTGEYAQFHLDRQGISSTATDAIKKEAVLSAIVTTMTRVNGIFERDVAIRMILVANNTNIIFLDALTDGFTNNDSDLLLEESQTVIDTKIGTANYDIGHTFSTGGGGLAQLSSPCGDGKARGITGSTNPIGDAYDIDYVSHEMGHQYGAHHTFNGEASNCAGANKNAATAVEPGSGSTIMSYAGLCAPQNVQNLADPYFHLVSIREMFANISTGQSTCAAISVTGNSAPTVNDLLNYTIPISTPFILNANALDINGDNLKYTWEQLDIEIATAPPVSTATVGPAFRSTLPVSSSMRYFPNQTTVNAGNLSNTWEVLPSVARTMRFGVNVRDNNPFGGQTASRETVVTFIGGAGPFKVTSQSAAVTWDTGTAQTITWNVANSNLAPVNCSFVNILLSVDGGLTYPITLASDTPNDGSQPIVVPNISTTKTVRIKVESVENIFYSVNTKNITIQRSEFIMNFDTSSKNVCIPENAVYSFTYNTFNEFNEVTTFSYEGNPAGTTVTFKPASASADNTPVQMEVNGIANADVNNYNISVIGTSSSITKTTVVNLGVFSSTINAPVLNLPANGSTEVLKPFTLSWASDVNALNYNVEIATDLSFVTIVEWENVNINSYNPQLLQPNTNYFWRVKSINGCGESSFSSSFNFTTENDVCDIENAIDVPLNIPDYNATGASSKIFITNNKIIRDVNVTVNITHPWIGDLDLMLISPAGTSVLLVASRYDEGVDYANTVFDDDASISISNGTAPYTGSFMPQGNLSTFNNEYSLGNWILKAIDSGPEDLGIINNWSIEICGVPSVFSLPSNNFNIEVIGETCPNKSNGQIIISAIESHNYEVNVTGSLGFSTTKTFTNNYTFENLQPDTYDFCIGVAGDTYSQCYTVEVVEGTTVSGKTSVAAGKASVEIVEGTTPFNIFVNGQEQFQTSSRIFSVDVKSGDVLEVKTSVSCEGIYSKIIDLFDAVIAYPNPTQGTFEITVPTTQTEVVIELYSVLSQLISVKTYPVVYGKVQISLENKPTGLYFAKVNLDKPVTLKIIKQ
ncbi:reprolysin-like metallopeptidase [Lutibacter sp.]|uniref:reprolysin-like metallopeptidase n=1 Tax=Lutibacter sp. TaxID=1925666 RepID=UPI003562D741